MSTSTFQINSNVPKPLPTCLPEIPAPVSDFLKLVAGNPDIPVRTLLEPYLEYEGVIRQYLAQDPKNPLVSDNTINLLSVFEDGNRAGLAVRARDFESETNEEKERYIMALDAEERKKRGDLAIVGDLQTFRDNFNIFTEGSLANLDWSNVVAAGSSVLTPLLVVPEKHAESKKTLREWYHEKLAPASDIDLFLYGFETEKDALAKIDQIEKTVKDNLLWETVTIRTKNTITIVSQYPNRHVQIVARVYKSISQILTGFDVNCSCFAYDGSRVLANPRALSSCITQCNDIDITRRSPSYENRLAKYAKRGFEIYCPFLDRSRIDPTIFERSYNKTVGLARLLVIEALPHESDREAYSNQRRKEMGRPQRPENPYKFHKDRRDKKQYATEEVAEWDFEEHSGYQKFTIPYGKGLNARNIERMFFKKDLVLNGEWNDKNRPPYRMVNLHRHPVFFGDFKDVVNDCCGFCPEPLTEEDRKVQEEEDKTYVRGTFHLMTYLEDDPGRQEVGSFNPISGDDYTEMAYVGTSEQLSNAIINNDVEYVREWCRKLSPDNRKLINERDYCGRTPLQLACMTDGTSLDIVQCLIDNGARLIARMQDGRTALHIAASLGRDDIVRALLKRSAANEEERDTRETKQRKRAPTEGDDIEMHDAETQSDVKANDSEMGSDDGSGRHDFDSIHMSEVATENNFDSQLAQSEGFVDVHKPQTSETVKDIDEADAAAEEEDDIYDIDIEDWDNNMSPLHHAIIAGEPQVVETLISEFGADPRRTLRIYNYGWDGKRRARSAVMNLTLAMHLKGDRIVHMVETLLKAGASTAQSTKIDRITAFQYFVAHASKEVLEKIFELDAPGAMSVINHIAGGTRGYSQPFTTPLIVAMLSALEKAILLLEKGARVNITLGDTLKHLKPAERNELKFLKPELVFIKNCAQPLEIALRGNMSIDWIETLLKAGADSNTVFSLTFTSEQNRYRLSNFGVIADQTKFPRKGYNALTYARSIIKQCKEALKQELLEPDSKLQGDKKSAEPFPLPDEASILDKYEDGGWEKEVVSRQLRRHIRAVKDANERLEKEANNSNEARLVRKKEAVGRELEKWVAIEKLLLEHGAKTYAEAVPEDEKEADEPPANSSNNHYYNHYYNRQPDLKQFHPNFHFHAPSFGEGNLKAGYFKLYQAIWRGRKEDYDVIRQLCLSSSGEGKEKLPPLRMAVQDQDGFSPLALAIYRGHYDMIDLILEIVDEQYEPADEKPAVFSKPRYGNDDDEDSDLDVMSEGGGINEEDFAVEDAAPEPVMVKCDVSPLKFLRNTSIKVSWMLSERGCDELWDKHGCALSRHYNWSALDVAIYRNDITLLRKLLACAETLAKPQEREAKSVGKHLLCDLHQSLSNGGHSQELQLALRLGRIEILEELMKRVSFGIHIEDLVPEDDEETARKKAATHYPGLSVRGKREKEWVDSAAPRESSKDSDRCKKVAQIAAHAASKTTMKWLRSEKPWECFQRYIHDHPDTTEVHLLEKQGNAVRSMFDKAIGLQTTLLPHIVIAGWHGEPSAEMLRLLISEDPALLNAMNDDHVTPALMAVLTTNAEAVKVLLELGADFSARFKNGMNILHSLLENRPILKPFKQWVELFPADVIDRCWTERMAKNQRTPFAYWLDRCIESHSVSLYMLRYLLDRSGGKGLQIANSEGNLPIHMLFQHSYYEAAKLLLELNPSAIYYENANGRTPVEIARSICLKDVSTYVFPINAAISQSISGNMAQNRPLSDYNDPEDEKRKEEQRKRRIEDGEEQGNANCDKKETYRLAMEVIEKLQANSATRVKRRLVSLADANNLARRLASGEIDMSAQKRRQGWSHQNNNGDNFGSDKSILSLWLQRSKNLENVDKKYTRQYTRQAAHAAAVRKGQYAPRKQLGRRRGFELEICMD